MLTDLSDITIDLEGHPRSSLEVQLVSPHLVSYYHLTGTYDLARIFYDVRAAKSWATLILSLQGHWRSNLMV